MNTPPQAQGIQIVVPVVNNIVQPAPCPVTWGVSRTPDGDWIALTFQTVTGTSIYFLDHTQGNALGAALTQLTTGLTIPNLTIPNLRLS